MNIKFVMAFVLSAWMSLSHANKCDEATTQTDMNACAGMAFKRADAELNTAYAVYRKRLSEPQKAEFKEVQLAWIKFRDASCKFESSGVEGGSVYPLIHADCMAIKTRARLGEINVLAACKEGDLSCPAPK